MSKKLLYPILTVVFNAVCMMISGLSNKPMACIIGFLGALVMGFVLSNGNSNNKDLGHGLLWGSLSSFILAVVLFFFLASKIQC